jgi:hypothetical protein
VPVYLPSAAHPFGRSGTEVMHPTGNLGPVIPRSMDRLGLASWFNAFFRVPYAQAWAMPVPNSS